MPELFVRFRTRNRPPDYFTYNPFDGRSALPGPGPVFIHRDECRKFDTGGMPPDMLDLPIFLEAFAAESRLVSRLPMDAARVDAQIDMLFIDPEVSFINLRNAEAGCFIAVVERAN